MGCLEMTQEEKIELYKDVISKLYEVEGRTITYISSLLDLERSLLSAKIKEWNLQKAQPVHFSPSTQKFINKHKKFIVSNLRMNKSVREIADELGVDYSKLQYVVRYDSELSKEKDAFDDRRYNENLKEKFIEPHEEDFDGEVWKEILGFSGYYVSNMGRFKKLDKQTGSFKFIVSTPNCRNGRLYVSMCDDNGKHRNVMAARIVAHTFCEGYSDTRNTVDYIDGNVANNRADNLEWVSQSENNSRKYKTYSENGGMYSRNGKFKYILLDSKYQFKTIRSLAKFLGVSETQAARYTNGETRTDRKIELVY